MAVLAQVPGGLMAGNVSPVRELVDPYPTFNSVALDVDHHIAVLSDNNMNGVLVYDLGAGSANGTGITPYLRHIQGPLTHIGSPVGVALDPVKHRIWVADNDIAESVGSFPYDADGDYPAQALAVPVGAYGIGLNQRLQQKAISEEDQSMIMIFRLGAHGGEPPLREIRGPHTRMADPYGLYWDEPHREITVTNHGDWNQGYWDADYQGGGRYYPPSITTFADDAKGDATPLRVIEGPRTRLNWPLQVAVNIARDEIAVANLGDSSVLIFKRTAHGNVAPLHVIAGPHTGLLYPTGVAYDEVHRELWVTNLGHTAMVFDSGADGDARPKRIIRSSPANSPVLGMSHPFNVAYDSKRDQLLVRNCNTDPRIGIFERLASGGQAPVRIVHGQRTRLTRTGHGIAYDAVRDEIVSSEATAGAIVVFKGGVDGDRAPIRIIQGPRTQLHQPWAVAVDDVHQELLAADYKTGAVLTYPLLAQGDVAPIRIIQGPRTGLGAETGGLAVDARRGLIVVSSYKSGLYVFNRTDNGNVAPRAHIRGPHAGFSRSGQIAVANGLIFAVVGSAGGYRPSYDGGGFAPRKDCVGPPDVTMNGLMTFIGVWSLDDNGDVPPRHFIHGPACEYTSGNGLAVNPRAGEIYLTDALRNGTFVYLVPSFFDS
ncbi:MAG TPA: hypothetical protein VKV28_00035 [Candidatus Binataceae bacterium]|nr:hypothetical protein [Candidatus Binataceae bacterium]